MSQPMPLISQGVPAYTNDDSSGADPASNANNSNYHDNWRCATTPAGNANNGTLTQPVYLAYDLSSVPLYQRQQILLIWYNDTPGIGSYNPSLILQNYFNNPNAYTIDVNAAPGGALPTSGWVTKITETNNVYHSRQYTFNMAGYNWIRINVTAILGSTFNNNAELDMDIHDAHLGVQDDWIFYGDSITVTGLNHDDSGGHGNVAPVQVHASKPLFYPAWENAGIFGYTAADFVPLMATYLPLFPGKYAAVNLGTNDANGGGSLVTSFSSNMQSIITSILNAGKIPVIPHIPYGLTANILANGPTINTAIDNLIAANPGCIAGPDLWAYFQANQSLISGDQIHPTDPAGYAAYRTQWANWAVANVYNLKQLATDAQTAYKVRMVLAKQGQANFKVRAVLKTPARTSFKVQLSGVGPQPYTISVTTHIKEHPFSTITSYAIVTNKSNVLQNGLTGTVTLTYPDNSIANAQVYWLGNGLYQVIYAAKDVGTIQELWTFTDTQGGKAEYLNDVPCAF